MRAYDAMQAWLPVPLFKFVGGPEDGKTLRVKLIETDTGLIAPEVWMVVEPQSTPAPSSLGRVLNDKVYFEAYRFVPTHGLNVGYYEWIAPRHTVD